LLGEGSGDDDFFFVEDGSALEGLGEALGAEDVDVPVFVFPLDPRCLDLATERDRVFGDGVELCDGFALVMGSSVSYLIRENADDLLNRQTLRFHPLPDRLGIKETDHEGVGVVGDRQLVFHCSLDEIDRFLVYDQELGLAFLTGDGILTSGGCPPDASTGFVMEVLGDARPAVHNRSGVEFRS